MHNLLFILFLFITSCGGGASYVSYKATKYNEFVNSVKKVAGNRAEYIVRYSLYDIDENIKPYGRIFMAKYDPKITNYVYESMIDKERKKIARISDNNYLKKSRQNKYNNLVRIINKLPNTKYKGGKQVDWREFIHLSNFIEQTPIIPPMQNYILTSRYGVRKHPKRSVIKTHTGVDLFCPSNDEIVTTANGRVIFIGKKQGYGKLVIIQHNKFYSTRYAHLDKIFVNNRQYVKVGDLIGLQGATGNVTGKHLHYEIRYNNSHINPQNFINAGKIIK